MSPQRLLAAALIAVQARGDRSLSGIFANLDDALPGAQPAPAPRPVASSVQRASSVTDDERPPRAVQASSLLEEGLEKQLEWLRGQAPWEPPDKDFGDDSFLGENGDDLFLKKTQDADALRKRIHTSKAERQGERRPSFENPGDIAATIRGEEGSEDIDNVPEGKEQDSDEFRDFGHGSTSTADDDESHDSAWWRKHNQAGNERLDDSEDGPQDGNGKRGEDDGGMGSLSEDEDDDFVRPTEGTAYHLTRQVNSKQQKSLASMESGLQEAASRAGEAKEAADGYAEKLKDIHSGSKLYGRSISAFREKVQKEQAEKLRDVRDSMSQGQRLKDTDVGVGQATEGDDDDSQGDEKVVSEASGGRGQAQVSEEQRNKASMRSSSKNGKPAGGQRASEPSTSEDSDGGLSFSDDSLSDIDAPSVSESGENTGRNRRKVSVGEALEGGRGGPGTVASHHLGHHHRLEASQHAEQRQQQQKTENGEPSLSEPEAASQATVAVEPGSSGNAKSTGIEQDHSRRPQGSTVESLEEPGPSGNAKSTGIEQDHSRRPQGSAVESLEEPGPSGNAKSTGIEQDHSRRPQGSAVESLQDHSREEPGPSGNAKSTGIEQDHSRRPQGSVSDSLEESGPSGNAKSTGIERSAVESLEEPSPGSISEPTEATGEDKAKKQQSSPRKSQGAAVESLAEVQAKQPFTGTSKEKARPGGA
eukprot:TRINITY_DN11056_c0_g1_i1.p1 TRINITY_DN11056_c0_g1~~TRINITY_DN11056_c0_g1_i1.p1  ORF type:complete len:764 (-),score=157.81 TRINITY_DN11056_c0_g1_i1:37-2142(-)